jgi:hypothetical protein
LRRTFFIGSSSNENPLGDIVTTKLKDKNFPTKPLNENIAFLKIIVILAEAITVKKL